MKNVLIIGHFGGNNIGDELMLESLVSVLRNVDWIDKILVVCKTDNMIQSDQFTYVNLTFIDILSAIISANSLILGGGTHFHDDYAKRRLNRHYLYLTKILIISSVFKILNRKVLYFGVGYGPLSGRIVKILTRVSVYCSDYIFVRDHSSFVRLKSLVGNVNKIKIGFDLTSLHKIFLKKNQKAKNLLGISMTSLEYSNSKYSDEFWQTYFFPELIHRFSQSDLEINIFGFRSGDRESDIQLSRKLFEELRKKDKSRVKYYEYDENIDEFVYPILECRYFIATRYHSAVLSFLANCHILIIPYHQKLGDLAIDIGLDKEAILDLESPETFSLKLKRLLNGATIHKADVDVKKLNKITMTCIDEGIDLIR